MKVVLLAGGFGTRISEETALKPKPMIEIGGKPILWHIMKQYSAYGIQEFIICCGYKGYVIKEYFANYYKHMSDLRIDLASGDIEFYNCKAEPWKVTLIDTGLNTMTGGRLKRIKEHVGNETFMMTYGDGISDVDIHQLMDFHNQNGKTATVTAVQPSGRFGALEIDQNNAVNAFMEKPDGDGAWINGGFFVLEPRVFDYLENDQTVFEKEPLESLARNNELSAYKHKGFWKPMDTLRDKNELEELWEKGTAPWKLWE